jgi:hypothetical protein
MRDYTQFTRPDFGLWAQPDPNSLIQDRAKNPAPGNPTQASPINAAPSQGLMDDAESGDDSIGLAPDDNGNGVDGDSAGMAPAGVQTSPPAPEQSRLGKLHDSLAHHFIGNQPSGYEGILTPEEIESAKPSLLHGMFSLDTNKNGKQQWQENLDNMVQHKMALANVAREGQLVKQRQDLFAKNPPPGPGATDAQNQAWGRTIVGGLTALGDYTGLQRLAPYFKELTTKNQPAGDYFRNKTTGEIQSFSKQEGTKIPEGWEKITTANAGDYQTWYNAAQNKYLSLPKDTTPEAAGAKDAGGYRTDTDFRMQTVQAGTESRFDRNKVVQLQKQYNTDIAPIKKNAMQYDKALTTINAAMTDPDPSNRRVLYGSVMSQFVQSGDQPNNLRYQLLQYYEHNITPTLYGSFEKFLDKFSKGELPPTVLHGMMSHIQLLANQAHDQIEKRRSEFLKNNSNQIDETQLPGTDTYFTYPGITGTGAGSASSAATPGGVDMNRVKARIKGIKP